MKHKKLLIFAFFSLFLNVALAENASSTRYVSVDNENLRSKPNGSIVAQLPNGTELKVIEKSGNWLKVDISGWIHEPSTVASLSSEAAKADVEFVKSEIKALGKDFSRGNKPFAAHVKAAFQFRNNSKKTVTGIIFNVKFLDGFNEVLFETELKDQTKIKPGKSNDMDTYWYWEDNPFMAEEVYDRLAGAAMGGTIKAEVKIKKAVFSDGSLVEY